MSYLMCPPTYFDVSYEINPWMRGNIHSVASNVAQYQWHALYTHVVAHTAVTLMEPQEGLPDMPFTANAGLVVGNDVVVSRFRYAERQGEELHFARWFAATGFEVHSLPDAMPFEGAGDALLDRGLPLLWCGYGFRTAAEVYPYIANLLHIEIEPLQLVDTRFYHLDTCFCPLSGGYLMYYPPAFAPAARQRIETLIPSERRIIVGEADAVAFACNAVNIAQTIILNCASPALIEDLAAAGFNVIQTPLSEFMKAGGAAKCLTLRLDEPPAAPA